MDLSQVAEIVVVYKNGEHVQYRGNGLEKLRREMSICKPLRAPQPPRKQPVRVVEDDDGLVCDENGVCPLPEVDDEYEEDYEETRTVTKTAKKVHPRAVDPQLIAAHSKGYHVAGLNYNTGMSAHDMQKQAAGRLSFS